MQWRLCRWRQLFLVKIAEVGSEIRHRVRGLAGSSRSSTFRIEPTSTLLSVNLTNQTNDLSPRLRVHRQEIDDVGPVVGSPVAVAQKV
jgi:hypothetical protein